MTRIREIKTTFTAGEVSPDLLGRGDLSAYQNGALKLRNVFIKPTGGVTRRPGMRYVDALKGAGKMIPLEFNAQQSYLLVLTDKLLSVYADNIVTAEIPAPWSLDQVKHISWTQSADSLLLVSPDFKPQILSRGDGSDDWQMQDLTFVQGGDGAYHQPYYKFARSHVTLQASGVTGLVTLSASADVFTSAHEGTRFRLSGREVEIASVDAPKIATAQVVQELIDTNPTLDWQEQAFSDLRGYPVTVAFHQGRLVLGGSRDLPNRLWFSKTGDVYNFDLGSGLDDEAIEFSILSDQVNAIRGIFSGRHLQVFTSGAEWMVTGAPLAPASVQILRQTRIGSIVERHIPPVNVDGASLYVSRSGDQVHEFIYTDLEQAYSSRDLALLSPHMVENPVDIDYDPKRRLLFIVRGDGRFTALTIFRSEQVAAWTMHDTAGHVLAITASGGEVYLMVERNGAVTLQILDDDLYFDYGFKATSEFDSTFWGGFDPLEGQSVRLITDGVPQPEVIIQGGAVRLDDGAKSISLGLPFTYEIAPLPPSSVGAAGGGRRVRLVEALFRLQDTAALRLDSGRGYADVALTKLGAGSRFDAPPDPVSGDVPVRALGWQHDLTSPLWKVQNDAPLAFTLLSVTTQVKVND